MITLPEYCNSLSNSRKLDFSVALKKSNFVKNELLGLSKVQIDSLKSKFRNYKAIDIKNDHIDQIYTDFVKAYDLFMNYYLLGFDTGLDSKLKSIVDGFSDLKCAIVLVQEANGILVSRNKYFLVRLFEPYLESIFYFIRLFKEVIDEGKSGEGNGIGIADILSKINHNANPQTVSPEKH